MSVHDKFIPNEQAVPVLETDVFSIEPQSRFAIGILGRGNTPEPGNEDLFNAYLRLRANVYIDQTNILDESDRLEDGTEMDANDSRSTHLVVVENKGAMNENIRTGLSRTAVIASMRIIQKTYEDSAPLPVEEAFKDDFANNPAAIGSVEISRYVIRHDERDNKAIARSMLYAVGLAHVIQNNFGPTYAVIEPDLEAKLQHQGVPISRVTEPLYIPRYKDYNLAARIDTEAFADSYGRKNIESLDTNYGTYMYWGKTQEYEEGENLESVAS